MQLGTTRSTPSGLALGSPPSTGLRSPDTGQGCVHFPKEGVRSEEVEPRTFFRPLSHTCVALASVAPGVKWRRGRPWGTRDWGGDPGTGGWPAPRPAWTLSAVLKPRPPRSASTRPHPRTPRPRLPQNPAPLQHVPVDHHVDTPLGARLPLARPGAQDPRPAVTCR